ncbi:imidazolonepropionase [Sinomicrobium soli]|uniref:imidazolonepropionase n=1 Tax=Sinomicrobium sp. N-1-3-6 TaxID=2219864 RepID=UPI000DCEFFE6|nr:imidazolonepropionase [Sinomicrobium sp. N-1-3-6]RAV30056.1 imidazolonepropionase [Sinomicrobium sp. N-1-3-6]
MKTLITNIRQLVQVRDTPAPMIAGAAMKTLPVIENAFLLIEDDRIAGYGSMDDLDTHRADNIIDASGRVVLPSWCDSHTHIVYAGNREQEFADRINGLSYGEIAARGGGILNSAKKLQDTPGDELYKQSATRLEEVISMGTGAVEIKSGYGLDTDAELKMLRVVSKLAQNYDLPVKATFLGAHAIPARYKNDRKAYLDILMDEMIPAVGEKKLASYIDVFCEQGYFTVEETESILEAGRAFGLIPKIHVNQFHAIGGVQAGIKHHALSVDHLEVMRDEDIEALKGTKTMPVALPSCSFFLGIPYAPARKMIDSGLPLALATDYNPGSAPSGNMNFVVATACIKMRMTPEEAINAATVNGAYAMGLQETHGSISIGKKANIIITKKIPGYTYIPYAFGSQLIDSVLINGSKFVP